MTSYMLVASLIVAPSLWLLRRSLDASLEEAETRELRGRAEAAAGLGGAVRFAAGVGVSAAVGSRWIAALFVGSRLRRRRGAARAFAQAKWVAVKRVPSGDELEDLSVSLDELGHRLREQLVE